MIEMKTIELWNATYLPNQEQLLPAPFMTG